MAGAEKMGNLPAAIEREVAGALYDAGDIIAAEMSYLITQGSSSGQSGGKHQHVPSLPGEPPNEEFGDLRNSIVVVPIPGQLRVDVQVNAAQVDANEDLDRTIVAAFQRFEIRGPERIPGEGGLPRAGVLLVRFEVRWCPLFR